MAVARLRERVLRRDLAGGAGAVLDDHALAERGAEALGDEARGQIGRTAGGEADDETQRLVGVLRVGRGAESEKD